jgi:hypothetical protein
MNKEKQDSGFNVKFDEFVKKDFAEVQQSLDRYGEKYPLRKVTDVQFVTRSPYAVIVAYTEIEPPKPKKKAAPKRKPRR